MRLDQEDMEELREASEITDEIAQNILHDICLYSPSLEQNSIIALYALRQRNCEPAEALESVLLTLIFLNLKDLALKHYGSSEVDPTLKANPPGSWPAGLSTGTLP